MVEYSAARCGALILQRYRHPEDWVNGADVNDELADMYLLRVHEIQRGRSAGQTDLEADANTFAIQSWAEYVSLLPPDVDISTVSIITVEDITFLAVWQIHWDTVLAKLHSLNTGQ